VTDFAVVIPTYRRPAYLAEAIRSVIDQTHPPAEVIVVCDGPGSSIPDELLRHPVRVIEQPHGGVSAARNTGIAATTSEWVSFLDDDDLWHPDRLRGTAAFLAAHRDCQAVTASSWFFSTEPSEGVDFVASDLAGCLDASGRVEPVTDMSYLDINGRSFELLLERNRGNISGATVRRDVLVRAGGFPAGFTCGEDWLMYINVARYTEWQYLDARLSFVRRHPGNNTSANPANGLTTVRAIRKAWSEHSHPVPHHRRLADYGTDYRWTVQNAVWDSIRRRHFRIAYDTVREGFPLLVRRRDQAYVLVPPTITWRIERLMAKRLARRGSG
jgi:glycosyltransferase involved in cell wall biosynthesis